MSFKLFRALRRPRLRSVLWLARPVAQWTAALAKNLPHRSRENEFSAGRVGRVGPKTDDMSFTSFTGGALGETKSQPVIVKTLGDRGVDPCPRAPAMKSAPSPRAILVQNLFIPMAADYSSVTALQESSRVPRKKLTAPIQLTIALVSQNFFGTEG